MIWRLPPLNPLRAFEAAARLGSITRAAEELNVTQAAVSKQIRALETALRQSMFLRLHRELRLTAAGADYFSTVTRIFGDLDQATRSLANRRERVHIRFLGYHTFNLRWLIPRLADFYHAHPDIEIDISAELGAIDFGRHEIDCAVRTGNGEWSDLHSVYMSPIAFTPVCRPLRPGDPPLERIEDLARHTLIMSATRRDVWRRWLTMMGHPHLEPAAWLTFDHGGYCYQAAVEGVGIAIGESVFVSSDIEGGRLTYPFPVAFKDTISYYFVSPHGDERPGVREFGEWMARRAAEDQRLASQQLRTGNMQNDVLAG